MSSFSNILLLIAVIAEISENRVVYHPAQYRLVWKYPFHNYQNVIYKYYYVNSPSRYFNPLDNSVRPGRCPTEQIVECKYGPYIYEETCKFRCNNDCECPEGHKCCDDCCFLHKICKLIESNNPRESTSTTAADEVTEQITLQTTEPEIVSLSTSVDDVSIYIDIGSKDEETDMTTENPQDYEIFSIPDNDIIIIDDDTDELTESSVKNEETTAIVTETSTETTQIITTTEKVILTPWENSDRESSGSGSGDDTDDNDDEGGDDDLDNENPKFTSQIITSDTSTPSSDAYENMTATAEISTISTTSQEITTSFSEDVTTIDETSHAPDEHHTTTTETKMLTITKTSVIDLSTSEIPSTSEKVSTLGKTESTTEDKITTTLDVVVETTTDPEISPGSESGDYPNEEYDAENPGSDDDSPEYGSGSGYSNEVPAE